MTDLIILVEVTAYDPFRSNDLSFSRDFTNAVWAKISATIVANAATSWDGQVLADRLVEAAATTFHGAGQYSGTVFALGVPVWASILVKPNGRTNVRIQTDSSTGFGYGDFDLAVGAVAGVGGIGVDQALGAYAGGWFRCAVKFIPSSAGIVGLKVVLGTGTSYANSYLGDGVSGVFLDQGQLVVEATLGDFLETPGVAGPGTKTFRWSTHPFVTTGADFPAHVAYDERVMAAPAITRVAFSNARVTGGLAVGGGQVELTNTDQALAELRDLGMDGREIVVRVGPKMGAFPGDFTTTWTATIEQPEIGVGRAILRVRDKLAFLQQPLQPNRYAGTNVLPSGAEGGPDDIQGQPKPDVWGRAYHVPLVMVNTAKWILQAHSGPIQAVDAVYDQGSPLTFGANRANLAAMEAATPAAGVYDTCLSLGLIRVNSRNGVLTATIQGDNAGGYVSRAGSILRRILETRCGIATAQLNTAAFTALDAAANYELGIWIGAETQRLAVINQVLASVGAWLAPDRSGIWTVQQLVAPAGTAVLALDETLIIDIESQATRDPDRGVPVWQVNLRYRPHWAGYGIADLLPGLAEVTKTALTQAWRTVTANDAAVQTAHLLAPTMAVDTLINSASDAAAERDRRLALHMVRRDFVRCRVPLTTATAALDLGSIVDVVTTRLGYGAGRKMVVIGVAADRYSIDLDLWG
jgi:hypothetical protein